MESLNWKVVWFWTTVGLKQGLAQSFNRHLTEAVFFLSVLPVSRAPSTSAASLVPLKSQPFHSEYPVQTSHLYTNHPGEESWSIPEFFQNNKASLLQEVYERLRMCYWFWWSCFQSWTHSWTEYYDILIGLSPSRPSWIMWLSRSRAGPLSICNQKKNEWRAVETAGVHWRWALLCLSQTCPWGPPWSLGAQSEAWPHDYVKGVTEENKMLLLLKWDLVNFFSTFTSKCAFFSRVQAGGRGRWAIQG